MILGFRGCRVLAGSGHWLGVRTLYVRHSGALLHVPGVSGIFAFGHG